MQIGPGAAEMGVGDIGGRQIAGRERSGERENRRVGVAAIVGVHATAEIVIARRQRRPYAYGKNESSRQDPVHEVPPKLKS